MESYLQEDCDRWLGGYMNVISRLNQRFTRYLVHFKSFESVNEHLTFSDIYNIASAEKEALS